jgi:amidophosphoribosyltransferase
LCIMQGVVGVYSKRNATRKAFYLLYGVQHRGQESAGISTAGDRSLRSWRGRGLVSNVFHEQFSSFMHPDDYVVIGCASGESANQVSLPPLELETDRYKMSVALDGYFFYRGDNHNEEVVLSKIEESLGNRMDLESSVTEAIRGLTDSYYSLVLAVLDKEVDGSKLLVARDGRGVRPLYIGLNEDEFYAASESAPLDVLEGMGERFTERKDVTPGSLVVYGDEGVSVSQVLDPQPAHCAFEWVYFGRPDSIIEGRSVHSARKMLGHKLVETHKLRRLYTDLSGSTDGMVLIPVPDSGRSVCTGVAETLGITPDEGVIKNAYLGRTYIIDDPDFRKIASDLKHNIIRETIEGKKVVITDDSIVRGTVSESIAKSLLKAGAAEVEFLVSYAPIFNPCFSDPPEKFLAAAPFRELGMREIGEGVASRLPSINRVRYNSPENVIEAIGLPENKLCTFCITGKSPFGRKSNH